MAITGNAGDGNSNQGREGKGVASAKYACFSDQQIEILEKVYAEFQNPTRRERLQVVHNHPVLKDLTINQIKVWFQNRRCREKQRKDDTELQAANDRLAVTNDLLREENDLLQKNMIRLAEENVLIRHHLENVAHPDTELQSESTANSPQLSANTADNGTSLLLLAEAIKEDFLLKATGDSIAWDPIPGIKASCDSIGIVYISHNCVGLAARACTVIPLSPIKIMEILKERASWSRDCRYHEVFAKYPTSSGGTIELVYMQLYALTTLASARDFWTLRYTSALEDGSLVVCEKSVSGSIFGINAPTPAEFIRANMLASGYLICPCEGGGSTIHIVDHLDLEASSVPNVLQPLYESSELVAQKLTVAALGHIELIAKEMSGKVPLTHGMKHASLRSFSQRLSRGFNDAINGFTEDGWLLMDYDASKSFATSTKLTKNLGITSNYDGILCVKASMLLQSVSPAMMVQLLRDRRSDWADIKGALFEAGALGFQGTHLSDTPVLIGHTFNENESLETIQVPNQTLCWRDDFRGNPCLLQICNGMDEKGSGACSELIFAPIDGRIPDNSVLLASGFRILAVGSNRDGHAAASHPATDTPSLNKSWSLLITAFQFPFERNHQEEIATRAQQYVLRVISCVQKIAKAAAPSSSNPEREINFTSEAIVGFHHAHWICQSYRLTFGAELLMSNPSVGDSLLDQLWRHQDAILCWSFKGSLQSILLCSFANQAGFDMLGTTVAGLQNISLDMILDDVGEASLNSVVPVVMSQGYAFLPTGFCLTPKGRYVAYEQAIAWKVMNHEPSVHCITFAFTNWSFV